MLESHNSELNATNQTLKDEYNALHLIYINMEKNYKEAQVGWFSHPSSDLIGLGLFPFILLCVLIFMYAWFRSDIQACVFSLV